jgi:LPS-assembly lipoprotein
MGFIIGQSAKKNLCVLVCLTLVLSLSACGFQLRGSINLSGNMSPIYIEQNSVFDLAREIKSLLASNEIDIVQTAQQSKSQLILVSENKARRVLSVDGSGQAREYLLSYTVNFIIKIKQAANTEASAVQDSVSVSRTWLFDPNAVLAVTNEADLLYDDMRREVARLILLKINARSINSALAGSDKP